MQVFPMTFDDFISYILLWVVGCISSIAGIGGGALLLPIFLFLMDLSLLVAIPTTIACIMGNSFVRATILYPRKHTVANTSLIDYTILWILLPADAIGSFLGAYLSNIVEAGPLLWVVSVVTLLTGLKTLKKGYGLRKDQLSRGGAETIHIDGISLQVLPVNSIDTGTYVMNDYAKKGLFVYEALFIGISCLRVSFPSHDHMFILLIVLLSLITLVVASRVNVYPQSSPNVKWDRKTLAFIGIAGFTIGAVSTLVGVGGGMFVAPLLLYINTLPEVMASTNSISTFFSSFATLFQYIVLGRVEHELIIFCMILSATSASVGLRVVAKSSWGIVAMLGTLIVIASSLMFVKASLG